MPVTVPGEAAPSIPPFDRRERKKRIRNRVVASAAAVAAVATTALAFAMTKDRGDQEVSPSKPVEAKCVKAPDHRAQLLATLAAAQTAGKPWTFETAQAAAARNGLTLTDNRRLIANLQNDPDAGHVSAQVDYALSKNFNGLRMGNSPNNPYTKSDALAVANNLLTVPPEIVKSVGINKIDIGSATPATVHIVDQHGNDYGNAGGLAGFTPRGTDPSRPMNYVWLGPGQAGWAVNHEVFGHGGQAAACTDPGRDSQFAALNPKGFEYKGKQADWKGVTLNEYGASSLPEDYATVANAVFNPSLEDCTAIASSKTIAEKAALIVERYTTLTGVEGADRYLAERFLGLCSLNLAEAQARPSASASPAHS